jgi:hypothetical protein
MTSVRTQLLGDIEGMLQKVKSVNTKPNRKTDTSLKIEWLTVIGFYKELK